MCPVGLGFVVEDKPTEFSCTCTVIHRNDSGASFMLSLSIVRQACLKPRVDKKEEESVYTCLQKLFLKYKVHLHTCTTTCQGVIITATHKYMYVW